jgi:hypothetical protein
MAVTWASSEGARSRMAGSRRRSDIARVPLGVGGIIPSFLSFYKKPRQHVILSGASAASEAKDLLLRARAAARYETRKPESSRSPASDGVANWLRGDLTRV